MELSPAELDNLFAHMLLLGIFGTTGSKHEFLSQKTNPTEKEARQALARILRNGDVPRLLLNALADHIDPDGKRFRLRRIEFKNLSQGHPRNGYYITGRCIICVRRRKRMLSTRSLSRLV